MSFFSVSLFLEDRTLMFRLPALLTDPQVLLFFCCRIARQLEVAHVSLKLCRQLEVVHVSLKLCPSVRSCARQFEVVPVS